MVGRLSSCSSGTLAVLGWLGGRRLSRVLQMRKGRSVWGMIGTLAGHFLKQVWTCEMLFCCPIAIWFLFREAGCCWGKNFLNAHFLLLIVADGARASHGLWWICMSTIFFSYLILTSILPLPVIWNVQWYRGFPGGVVLKIPPASARITRDMGSTPRVGKIPGSRKWQPTLVFSPGNFPWTDEPSGLQSMGSQRVGHNWAHTHAQ